MASDSILSNKSVVNQKMKKMFNPSVVPVTGASEQPVVLPFQGDWLCPAWAEGQTGNDGLVPYEVSN